MKKLNIQKKLLMFSSFFLLIAENLNLHQVGKEDPISFLKHSFPCKFHDIKIVSTSLSPSNQNNSSGYDEIMSKIPKACESLIS